MTNEQQLKNLSRSNIAFGSRIFAQLCKNSQGGNVQYSPGTLAAGLSMLTLGAKSPTDQVLLDTLNVTREQLADYRLYLMKVLSINQHEGMESSVGSAIFPAHDITVEPAYMEQIQEIFSAVSTPIDYSNPAKAIEIINGWSAEKTNGRIKKVLGECDVDPLTAMVLANALFLKGDWKFPFVEEHTRLTDFQSFSGTISVDMMRQDGRYQFAQDANGWYVRLPFVDERFAMLFYLPDDKCALEPGNETALLNAINPATARFETKPGYLYLPKFDFTARYDLKDALTACGLGSLFVGPNLEGISPALQRVDKVIHKTNCKVTEKGAEMSAVNAISASKSAGPRGGMTFNRTFLYFFTDLTGQPYLVGKMDNPTVESVE